MRMKPVQRSVLALCISPAVPAVVLVLAAFPFDFGTAVPLAKALLVYGYVAAFAVALPLMLVFKMHFSRKPASVIWLSAALGALVAVFPFLLALFSGQVSAADWPSFFAMFPLLAMGAAFGAASGVTYLFVARRGVDEKASQTSKG